MSQEIRDLIYEAVREEDRKPIYDVAYRIEQFLREKIAQDIEQYIDADHEARAFTFAANIARGRNA